MIPPSRPLIITPRGHPVSSRLRPSTNTQTLTRKGYTGYDIKLYPLVSFKFWSNRKCELTSSLPLLTYPFVAYWPPTQPSCQKKKCTCYLHRCIQSKISGDKGRPWLSRGWIECEIVTLAGSGWASNYYISPATGSSGQLEFRSVGEKMLEWEPCPREAGPPGPRLSSQGERERKAVIARRVGVNIFQFCSVSNSLSHTALSIKWEVYFSKELCPLVFFVYV